jgi:hypothetical protein
MLRLFRFVALASVLAGLLGRGAAHADVDCAKCHANHEFLVGKRATPEADAALFVPAGRIEASVHASLTCVECHSSYDDGFPHATDAVTRDCQSCHDAEGRGWEASIHAVNASKAGDAPRCVDCHGAHDVLTADDRSSPTHPLNEAALCARCHADERITATYFADPADSVAATAVARYHETVHGIALERSGLVVSATCSDCHDAHRVLPSDVPGSTIHRDLVPETCGKCHVGVLETYRESVHGTMFATGRKSEDGHEPPVCTTCHSAHGVVPVDAVWKSSVVDECRACHEHAYETYMETYHGKVTRLGSALAAKCSDCHTAHANFAADDARSTVSPANLETTCGQCHPRASAQFVKYHPHGDPHDREAYPVLYWPWKMMSSLLLGVFAFFGIHTFLWFGRGLVEVAQRGKQAREAIPSSGARAAADAPSASDPPDAWSAPSTPSSPVAPNDADDANPDETGEGERS